MQNRIYKTRAIVETGIMSALLVVFILINAYIPLISSVGLFILPIPITILYIRYNFKYSLASIIVGLILGMFLVNPIVVLSVIIMYGLVGFTLGYCIKNKVRYFNTIIIVGIAFLIGTFGRLYIYAIFIDKSGIVSMVNDSLKIFKISLNEAKNAYISMGIDKDKLETNMKIFDIITIDYILKSMAAIIILTSIISSYLNYLITRNVLKKIKIETNEPTPFTKLFIPNLISAFLIILICIGLLLKNKNMLIGDYILTSSLILFQYIFVVQGISLLSYYLKNKFKLKNVIIILIIILTILSPLQGLFIYVGLFDLIFDFRKIDPNRTRGKLEE